MYWLRGCTKCGGDLYLERDKFGSYVSCIQCGNIRLDFDVPVMETTARTVLGGSREQPRAA